MRICGYDTTHHHCLPAADGKDMSKFYMWSGNDNSHEWLWSYSARIRRQNAVIFRQVPEMGFTIPRMTMSHPACLNACLFRVHLFVCPCVRLVNNE